jgi:hypothetical protein
MAQFSVNVFRPVHRLGGFGAQEFAETLPKPVYRHFYAGFA